MTYKLFKTSTCAYCPMVLKFCERKNVTPEQILIDDDVDTRNWLQRYTGATTVPILIKYDGDTPVGFAVGWNPGKLTELLG